LESGKPITGWTDVDLSLKGLNKSLAAAEFGETQVRRWRRSFDEPPPMVEITDSRYPGHDARYKSIRPHELPQGESLKDTATRLRPCWQHSILAALERDQKVLVSAHGNSNRALVKYLNHVSDDDIADVEIPYAVPLIYELSSNHARINSYYLGQRAVPEALPVPALNRE
jgi:2,3-bisphosphoglycerate-dependent phosphoglycerate mutase